MKAKHWLMAMMCVGGLVLTSCEKEVPGDATFIEGAWELRTASYDKTVYADQQGNSHLKDSAYTRTYGEKEQVWLFYQNHISWWEYGEYEGEGFWSGYMCDCYRNYVTEGEGNTLEIVETSGSIIPGVEGHTIVTRYKVEKITNKQMILSCVDKMYISDTQSTVDVHVEYTFKRENTLLDYIRSEYEEKE